MKVIIASTNPVKIEATRRAFFEVFDGEDFVFQGVAISSEVSHQPMTDEETLRGATNRVRAARDQYTDADFWVGLEGGVEDINGELHQFSWTVVQAKDGREGKGRSATYIAPPIYRDMVIKEHKDVGGVGDIVFGTKNSKQGPGASGLLTGGIIDRVELDRHATIFALIPWIKPELY